MQWFDVDKSGLCAQLERRGKGWAIFELVQNAWDSGAGNVAVRLTPIDNAPYATLEVEDDSPTGFIDLSHAFTMFAASNRAGDPSKRGRFNMGEKMVLALCRLAKIETTTGTVTFDDSGRRKSGKCRERGTLFTCEIRMTRAELAEVEAEVLRLIPPIPTTFNGETLDKPAPIKVIEARLPTELAGDDGVIRRSTRIASIELYPCEDGGEILELGIPVVEAEIGFRANVMQKVPLNTDRDNVPPAFVKSLRVAVVNEMADAIEDAAEPWVADAIADARIQPAALKSVLTKRFGERAVVAVPGDPMANAAAESAGYTVIHGGAMSAGAWANARKANAIPSSSSVFPSPKPEVVAAQNAERAAAGVCPLCGK